MTTIRYKKMYKQLSSLLCKNDFFVNIGANDGLTNDPIFDFIEPFSLQGIAVEPVDMAFNKLVENYKNFSGVLCLKAAISVDTNTSFFRLRDDLLAISPHLAQISTQNLNQLVASVKKIKACELDPSSQHKVDWSIFHIEDDVNKMLVRDNNVLFLTFEKLVALYNISKIDLLNIDAEGNDFKIFMSIDLDIFSPKILILEEMFFSESEKLIASEKLTKHHYKFIQMFEYYSSVYIKST